jgi:hypothetical protein
MEKTLVDAERFLRGRLPRGEGGWYLILLEVWHVEKPSVVFFDIDLVLWAKARS